MAARAPRLLARGRHLTRSARDRWPSLQRTDRFGQHTADTQILISSQQSKAAPTDRDHAPRRVPARPVTTGTRRRQARPRRREYRTDL